MQTEIAQARNVQRRAIASDRRRRQSGHVLITTTLALVVLIGFVGLAVDVGYLQHVKRRMQAAADAGAMAGGQEYARGSTDAVITTAAKADTAANGFTDGASPDGRTITVEVHRPPTMGAYAGNPEAVEVIIRQPQPTFFMRVMNFLSADVSARAVAIMASSQGCLLALSCTDRDAMVLDGSTNAQVNCGVMVNSSNSRALNANGGATLDAYNISTRGGYSGDASNFDPYPVSYFPAPLTDPLADLAAPPVGDCTAHPTQVKISSDRVLTPGTYCGGIQITGGNVTFSPGMYVLGGGGFSISGSGSVTGNGVTFYNATTPPAPGSISTYNAINIAGTGTIRLSAPTDGTYAGILFFQDRAIKTCAACSAGGTCTSLPQSKYLNSISGGAGSIFNGVLYFPTTGLSFTGTSDQTGGNIAIFADTIKLAGTVTLNGDFSSLPGGAPFKMAVLGE